MSSTLDRRRRLLRTAAAGAVVLVAGLIPGTGVAVDEGEQSVGREFAHRCLLPGGERPATVRISAVLPRQVPVGRPVRVEQVTVRLRLGPEAVGDLRALGAAGTGGAARLTTKVAQRGEPTEVDWSQLSARETKLPAEGDHTIEAAGAVPTVTARSGGELTFSAGTLTLDLLMRTADDAPTTPPGLSVTCVPVPDADTTFARVAVLPAPGASGRPTPPSVDDSAGRTDEGPAGDGTAGGGTAGGGTAGGGRDTAKDPARRDGADDDCPATDPIPLPPTPGTGYIAGYSNVAKLGSAMFLKDPGFIRVNMSKAIQFPPPCNPPDGPQFTIYSDATFDHHGKPQIPPARSTFLTFGFMPTTATVELSLDGPIELVTRSYPPDEQTGRFPETTTATARLWVRLYDVKVDGTPLPVGPKCRTARPMELVLTGKGSTGGSGPEGYTVANGGPLTAVSTIPPFSGCGVGEDLDRLFTASLSGEGNYTKMTQGPLCTPESPHCPDPPRPKPER
ncbi:DUF6801 domain-containing protein [Streptomyces sp. SP18CS02]|uniref:DUF6801 domain-containing protein n=1 Tax=Streptomyces sp. SP18CS02 TaxID=3002531 RepID=UPI002E76E11C|nr:DUF6801 domain-containing protein [Streptomyces sp. SP18CS02]MEE1754020.1 hypothetical protein [Streptomyces sp. SP18CS02]